MSFDKNAICPCGIGKKAKFCCCKDFVNDLVKVARAIEGEQRVAALDQVIRLIKEHGERDALVAIKASLQMQLGTVADAKPTIQTLAKNSPHNPVAAALTATIEAHDGHTDIAIEKLQQALESIDGQVPTVAYSAIGLIIQALVSEGNILAARAHANMQLALTRGKHREPIDILMKLNGASQLPLLAKADFQFTGCPEDAPWRGEFEAAMHSAKRGAWLAASENLTSLSQKVPDQPAIIANLAVLLASLGKTKEAVEAWHAYARLPEVSEEEAVEAEAMAQYFGEASEEPMVDVVEYTYPVRDTNRLMEQLVSDRRIEMLTIDTQDWAEEDTPPPRGAFRLLDRDLPRTVEELKLEDIPTVLGDILVYGKETDRDARLQFTLHRTAESEDAKGLLVDLAGEFIEDTFEEKVLGEVPRHAIDLTFRLRLPDELPAAQREEFTNQNYGKQMIRWLDLPHTALDGKSPREAATEPDYRRRVLGAISVLELASRNWAYDYNQLRSELGLPLPQTLSGDSVDIDEISDIQLKQLDASTLDDDALISAFQRATMKRYSPAMILLGDEVLRRKLEHANLEEVHDLLIGACPDSGSALDRIAAAKEYTESLKKSPARWLLREMTLRIPRMEIAEVNTLLQTIKERHLREPGVAEQLRDILARFGLLREDGQMEDETADVASDPNESEPGQIWTPGSAQAGSGESKLWVPGQD